MMITAVAMKRKDPFPNHQPPKPLQFWALTYIAVLGTVFLKHVNWWSTGLLSVHSSGVRCLLRDVLVKNYCHNTVTVDCKLTNADESLVVAAFDRHESVRCHINHDHDYNWLTQPVCNRRRDLLAWKPAKDFSQSCSAWGGFTIFKFSSWGPQLIITSRQAFKRLTHSWY